ncbi:MAG: HEAT repeat domain-containing protein [Myxococcota bacterium]
MTTRKGKDWESALTGLLRHQDPDRRVAAAIVLGDLDLYTPAAVGELRKVLDDPEARVRRHAVEAMGALAPDGLARDLQPRLIDSDPSVQSTTRAVLARAKNIGPSDLEQMLEAKDEKERLGAVAVLAARADVDSMARLAQAMAVGSQRLAEAAREAMEGSWEAAGTESVSAFVEGLRTHVSPSRLDERPALAETLSEMLGGSSHEGVISLLLGWLQKSEDAEARAAVAGAVRRQLSVRRISVRQYEGLLEILESESTPENVVTTVADALTRADLPVTLESRVRKLLESSRRSVRDFAIEALGKLDSAPAAKAIAEHVKSGDPTDQKHALQVAVQTSSGRSALARVLPSLNDVEQAEAVARALRSSGELLASTVQQLETGALDAPPDISKIILGLLRQLGSQNIGRVQGSLQDKALKLKNRGEFAEAGSLFERIAEGADDPSARYELGVCQLMLSKKHLSRGSSRDPAVATFALLSRRRDFATVDRLAAENILDGDALFYLGFSLSEGQGDGQNLGGDILTHLSEGDFGAVSRKARNKLVTMGWLE